jgi:uncharacterized repeat protein (TIGR03943 family)
MNKIFSRWLPCATLAAWSSVLLYFYFSGRIHAFLHPTFRPYVLIAGIAMGVMALVFLLFPADANCCSAAECGHGLSRVAAGKVLTFLILLVPVTAAAMFSPDNFGKNVMLNRVEITDASSLRSPTAQKNAPPAPVDMPLPTNGATTASNVPPAPAAPASAPAPAAANAQPAPPQDYLQRTPDGRIVAEVLDLLYAAQDNALRKDFEGKSVELIGQLMPDTTNNPNGNRFKAVRMFMTCCAADARPVAALVQSDAAPKLPEMSWIKVTGTATFPIENGRRIAVLKADKVEKVNPPEETMLY